MLEMQYIIERALQKGAVAMITTAKDAVKIPTEFIYFNREMPLYILNMDILITEGEDVLDEAILTAIKKELKQ
jgi:tetraacyldisaccharide-1-P 4'-kinase